MAHQARGPRANAVLHRSGANESCQKISDHPALRTASWLAGVRGTNNPRSCGGLGRLHVSHSPRSAGHHLVCAAGGGSERKSREDPMDSHEESDHEASFEASPSSNGPRNAPAAAMPPSPADITEVKQLVEVAMLAAMTGLAYFLAAIVKLEGYLGYFLPLPVVIASMRWGSSTGWRTVFATCCLVAVLLGPIRMLGYLCNHGLLAGTLGVAWAAGLPWAASVPICAIVRTTGMLAHLIITSWAVNENLFQLLLSNVYALLDQILSVAGSSAVPTQGAIIAVCGVLLLANALVYMTLMNVLYAVILRNMGYKGIRIPQRIERVLYPQTAAA